METSLNVYDYPEPEELKEKTVRGKINISFDIEADIPEDWEDEKIMEYLEGYVRADLDYLENLKIENIEL